MPKQRNVIQDIQDKINYLTSSQGYGEVVIVIRAGLVRTVKTTSSENYDDGGHREEPGSPKSCKK